MPSSQKWTAADLPALDGRTYVVTGATNGLGLETARALAGAGAQVVLAVRDLERGAALAAELPDGAQARHLDLADLASVRAFADAWGDAPIAGLVANAGVMATPLRRTADGFELQFGTNHLGHFALVNLLLEHVTDRVVVVSSMAHRQGAIDLDDLNWERRSFRTWSAYGQSKLANLLFVSELQRRLDGAGSPVRAIAAHPGYAATNLQFHTERFGADLVMGLLNRVMAQSAEAGAWPTLYGLVADVPGDSFVGPDGFQQSRGHPKLVGRSAAAQDRVMAQALWERSEALTGVTFGLAAGEPARA
ncbi:oxidoreductase [Conexibacter sp. SYSU D00693]|uniref:oxidoreductase n=1 Tax=Conexibacter sp. SYSU D00693 TaxID=2812560 RepID=UPI00196A2599|nr:oxidoreductase [Conexibacter sp. SYSU D00693]